MGRKVDVTTKCAEPITTIFIPRGILIQIAEGQRICFQKGAIERYAVFKNEETESQKNASIENYTHYINTLHLEDIRRKIKIL